jgi:hypothetical protein
VDATALALAVPLRGAAVLLEVDRGAVHPEGDRADRHDLGVAGQLHQLLRGDAADHQRDVARPGGVGPVEPTRHAARVADHADEHRDAAIGVAVDHLEQVPAELAAALVRRGLDRARASLRAPAC